MGTEDQLPRGAYLLPDPELSLLLYWMRQRAAADRRSRRSISTLLLCGVCLATAYVCGSTLFITPALRQGARPASLRGGSVVGNLAVGSLSGGSRPRAWERSTLPYVFGAAAVAVTVLSLALSMSRHRPKR